MKQIRKALVAAGFAFAGTLGGLLSDGKVTLPELLLSAGAGLTAGAATWKVSNEPS